MFKRLIIANKPNDKESEYSCTCGFHEYLSEKCVCGNCENYELPLVRCPNCGSLNQGQALINGVIANYDSANKRWVGQNGQIWTDIEVYQNKLLEKEHERIVDTAL